MSETEAQDLIHEALLRTLEYCKENEVHNVEAFLEKAVNNLAIDRYRHAQRYPHEKEDIHRLEQRLPLVSPVHNLDEVLGANQRLHEIRVALNELLEGTGDIFVLHHMGYSYKELAARFEFSESTIEKRMYRAMQWIQEQKE